MLGCILNRWRESTGNWWQWESRAVYDTKHNSKAPQRLVPSPNWVRFSGPKNSSRESRAAARGSSRVAQSYDISTATRSANSSSTQNRPAIEERFAGQDIPLSTPLPIHTTTNPSCLSTQDQNLQVLPELMGTILVKANLSGPLQSAPTKAV